MKNLVRIAFIVLVVALVSGCGLTNNQIVKTQAFGAATADIGKLGEEEFINIRNGIIEMNKERVSIDNTKTSKDMIFDKPTYAEDTSKRIAACKALKLYGEVLVKLVTEDRSENLQKAANALIDNTTVALNKDLSDEQKGAINKIIVGLGSFWVDKKKADAAKEIIPAFKQPVDDLAELLRVDFSLPEDSKDVSSEDVSSEDVTLGYLNAYNTTAKRLRLASMKLVNAGNRYTVLERDRAVHAFEIATEAINRAQALAKTGKNAIDSLKKANAELVKVIGKQEYSTEDIKNYAKQVQELVNMFQVLTK
jgi:hypothetical protein